MSRGRHHWKAIRLGALIALLVVVGLVAATGPARAQGGGAVLSAAPDAPSVQVDAASFKVNLNVSGVTNATGLGGYDIYINYDPAVIQAVDGADSGFIQDPQNTQNIVVCVPPTIDNNAGRIILSCVTVPLFVDNGPTIPGQKLLATAIFKPVAAGTSQLDLTGSTLTDPNGGEIAVTLQSSQVAIAQTEAAPTATLSASAPTATTVPSSQSSATPEPTSAQTATVAPTASVSSTPGRTVTSTAVAAGPTRGAPTAGAGAQAGSGGSATLPIVLGVIGALLAASVVAGFVWRRRRRSPAP